MLIHATVFFLLNKVNYIKSIINIMANGIIHLTKALNMVLKFLSEKTMSYLKIFLIRKFSSKKNC